MAPPDAGSAMRLSEEGSEAAIRALGLHRSEGGLAARTLPRRWSRAVGLGPRCAGTEVADAAVARVARHERHTGTLDPVTNQRRSRTFCLLARQLLVAEPVTSSFDPLSPEARRAELAKPRPKRGLPFAPLASPGRRHLPLAAEARDVDRRYRPIYAVWEITLACDLACRHCGSRAGRARPDELSTAEALDLVHQLADLGTKEVTLIGGEAYLRDDWLDIVRAIRRRGMEVTMTSGGRGLTADLIARAHDAGLMGVSVSIDGDEETHDRLRGVSGAYRSAIDAMRELQSREMRVACNTQINRLSTPCLEGILETIRELGVHAWQLALTVPMGRAADEPDVLLQPHDLLSLFPLLAQLKQRCDELDVRMWPGNNIGYFGPFESVLRGSLGRGHAESCGAGRATLGIEANGAIKGCPSLPSEAWTGGNVRDERLVDIWERAEALRYTRDRTQRDLWGFCQTCYYAEECMSGCTWTSFVSFGRPGNNPYCHHRALEMQRAGKRERIVRAKAAPGAPFDHGTFEIVVEDIDTERQAARE